MSDKLEKARQRVIDAVVRLIAMRANNFECLWELEIAIFKLNLLEKEDGGRMNPDSIGEQS